MKKSITILMVSAFLMLANTTLRAQEVIGTSGSQNKTGRAQLSWTIGEVAVNTLGSASMSITEGFHQSKLIVSDVEQFNEIPFPISVYPNPVSTYVTLKIEESKLNNLTYQLFNIDGRKISSKSVVSTETVIDFTALPATTYLLRVSDNKKEVAVITIVKTK